MVSLVADVAKSACIH